MKVLIHANAPWCPTGYGNQAAQLALHLKADGHDPAFSVTFGYNGPISEWAGMPIFPSGFKVHSPDTLLPHAETFFGGLDDGLILTLIDLWVLPARDLARTHCLPWAPVDHSPPPPRVLKFLAESGARPVAMSRFGEEQLRSFSPFYAPHGIDLELFQPLDYHDAREAVAEITHGKISRDSFLCFQLGTNKGKPIRKGYPESLSAYAKLRKQHDDVQMIVQSEPLGVMDGMDMQLFADLHGLTDKDIFFVGSYESSIVGQPPEVLRILYSAADAVLHPSYGEGFGIPIIEAQACGTRVVTQAVTSMPELTGPGSIAVGTAAPFWTYQDSWMFIPSIDEIYDALEQLYGDKTEGPHQPAVEFASQYGETEVYKNHWRPIVAEMEQKLAGQEPEEVEVVA